MALKKVGYYISKGKCCKVYSMKKRNRAGKLVTKKVNYKRKVLKKGTKVYKTKRACTKVLNKKAMKRKTTKRSPKRSPKRKTTRKTRSPIRKSRRTRFGQSADCHYSVPYFGQNVPSVAKYLSGTTKSGLSSYSWGWPTPPGALSYDLQQGKYSRN